MSGNIFPTYYVGTSAKSTGNKYKRYILETILLYFRKRHGISISWGELANWVERATRIHVLMIFQSFSSQCLVKDVKFIGFYRVLYTLVRFLENSKKLWMGKDQENS